MLYRHRVTVEGRRSSLTPIVAVTALLVVGITPASASPSGKMQLFETPHGGAGGLTTGPEGNIWFTEKRANRVGEIGTSAPPATVAPRW
jgi:streptogramin lyase